MSLLPSPSTASLATQPGPPVELGRDEARVLARRELSNPDYDADPSLLERAIGWVLEKLGEFFDLASGVSPGGWAGVLVLAALLTLAYLIVRRRVGPFARTASRPSDIFETTTLSATEHRMAADAASAGGDYVTAVVERFRAIVRDLEERDVLDARPGRTIGEVVDDVAGVLPTCAEALSDGAVIFAAVRYGSHPATADQDVRLREIDDLVRAAQPAADHVHRPASAMAVPR